MNEKSCTYQSSPASDALPCERSGASGGSARSLAVSTVAVQRDGPRGNRTSTVPLCY